MTLMKRRIAVISMWIGLYVGYILLMSHIVVLASSTSNFTQTITAGSLAIDIVNGSYVTVASPAVAMGSKTFSFACQTSTGTLGTVTQMIYVYNPDAADAGWTASLAGSATTALWASAGPDYDFNDPTTSGCTDGADADAFGGQMTVDASGGTLAKGQCATCVTTNVTKGSSGSFNEGTTNSITVLAGAAGSDDIGDWTLIGVAISQKIPAEQIPATDYNINMVLSIVAL